MEKVEVINEPGRIHLVRFETDKMSPSLRVAWRMLKTRALNWVKETYNEKEILYWQTLNSCTQCHWSGFYHDEQVVGGGFIPGQNGQWTFTLKEMKKQA